MKLSTDFEFQLQKALQQAHKDDYEIFSIEHMILCLLETSRVKKLVQSLKIQSDELKKELSDYLTKNIPKNSKKQKEMAPIMSVGAQRMLQTAWHHAMNSGKSVVNPEDLLVTLYAEEESYALHLLRDKYQLSRMKLLNEISHGSTGLGAENSGATSEDEDELFAGAIDSFCIHWDDNKKNQIDDFIARDYLLKRLVQILSRKTRNNPLLIGDSGVGKTALARNFAKRLLVGNVPKNLKDMDFYELSLSKMIAGAKFRGELEERFGQLYKELEKGDRKILFIDDIASLLNTGNSQGQGLDVSHILRPFLENESIHVIACCNHKEYKNIFEKNTTNTRFFQKMNIEECSKEEAILILQSKIKAYEKFHSVVIPDSSIEKATELAMRYLGDRKLPDSALDLIDETCAREKLKDSSKNEIRAKDLSEVVSEMSGVATENLNSTEGSRLKDLEKHIKEKIFGQDKAVEALVNAVKFSFAGLSKENKPIGSYLFAGPTGVGKTELAIQLSKNLGLHFEKFDMSEYLEKHSVARLVGAPPGYVGYEEGGLLTDAISKNPYSVILMDEIEKAHPDLINILLQIMDSGSITDANGKHVDCRNLVLIMTSNAGSKDQSKGSIGIAPPQIGHFDSSQLKNFFSPEFLNRLDAIVDFSPLSKEILFHVATKFLDELKQQLEKKKVSLTYSTEVARFVVEEAFDPLFGARPLGRKIDELIKKPLVDEILYGELENGGNIELKLSEKKIEFKITGLS